MARKIRKLGSLDTHGVALVDRGANMKRFAIAKREAVMNEKYLKLLMDVIAKGDLPADQDLEKLFDGLDDGGKETLKAIGKLYAAQKDSEAFKSALGKMLGMGAASASPAPTAAPAAKTENEPDGNEGEEETEMAKKLEEQVQKAVTEKTSAVLKAQQDIIKSLQEDIQKSRDDAKRSEWVAKAERDLQFVPNKMPAEMGQMLFELEKADAKLAETQFATFKSLSSQMQSITKSRGFNGESPYKGGAQHDAFQEIMKSATGTGMLDAAMTVMKSRDVFKDNVKYMQVDQISKSAEYEAVAAYLKTPAGADAYDAYLNEHPEQTKNGPTRAN